MVVLAMFGLALLGCRTSPTDRPTIGTGVALPLLAASTSVRNDDSSVTYTVASSGGGHFFRVYVDTDRLVATGYLTGGIGAEFLVENGALYRYTGDGASWSWSNMGPVTFTNSAGIATWTITRAALEETNPCNESSDLVFDIDDNNTPKITELYAPAAVCTGVATTPPPTSTPPLAQGTLGISSPTASNDAQNVAYQMTFTGTPTFWRSYIDTDQNPQTGFAAAAGVGADYLLENGTLYQHGSSGWSWTSVGAAAFTVQGQRASWLVSRSALNKTAACGENATLLFQVEDGTGTVASSALLPESFANVGSCGTPTSPPPPVVSPPVAGQQIKQVFVITMENESAAAIYGSSSAPYLNGTILPRYARSNSFSDPLPDSIPSEPHYIWMEAGTNQFSDTTFTGDADPSASNSTRSTAHLVTQMQTASPSVSWLSFQEGLNSSTGSCPIHSAGFYAAKHDPFVFFQDVAGSPPSASDPTCAAHHRAYTTAAFSQALAQGTVAQYNFITPDLCNDMHGASGCIGSDDILRGDQWLQTNLPPLIDYVDAHSGVIFIVWDEPVGGSTLIPFLAIGPQVKANYASSVSYTHGSLTRSVEEIFGLPVLPTVANANDLRDLFNPGFFP